MNSRSARHRNSTKSNNCSSHPNDGSPLSTQNKNFADQIFAAPKTHPSSSMRARAPNPEYENPENPKITAKKFEVPVQNYIGDLLNNKWNKSSLLNEYAPSNPHQYRVTSGQNPYTKPNPPNQPYKGKSITNCDDLPAGGANKKFLQGIYAQEKRYFFFIGKRF
jgi:hypothetical protein